jgi:hypothetical protein
MDRPAPICGKKSFSLGCGERCDGFDESMKTQPLARPLNPQWEYGPSNRVLTYTTVRTLFERRSTQERDQL